MTPLVTELDLGLIEYLDPDRSAQPTVYLTTREKWVAPAWERSATETLIVCLNCAGEEENPRKTFLTRSGRCDSCGGRSYFLASTILSRRNLFRQEGL